MVECIFVGIGGFTTFSTFAYETASLMSQGSYLLAAAYMGLSMILGTLAVFTGQYAILL